MNQKTVSNQKKTNLIRKNNIEAGKNSFPTQGKAIKNPGAGFLDQIFGGYQETSLAQEKNDFSPRTQRQEFSLFNYNQYYEKEVIKKEIKELTEQVRKEITLLKKAESSLLNDVKDIEKLSVEQLPEKPGIYHLRFLEVVLTILRALRAKVGESRTWLQAFVSKRKKRGSLFMSLSKKKGTQFSLSQELQATRAVQ